MHNMLLRRLSIRHMRNKWRVVNIYILAPACTAILVFTEFLACVASDSARVRRERWDKSKKRKRNDGGGGGERRFLLLPSPSPSIFYCSRSNFRAITQLETLATYVGYRVPCSASLFCMIDLTHLMLRHRPLSFSRKFDGVILVLFFISQ